MRKRGKYWYITVAGVRKSSGTSERSKAAELEKKLNAEAWERKHLGVRFATWDEACLDWFQKKKTLRSIKTQTYWEEYWSQYLTGKSLISITGDYVRGILLKRPGVTTDVATKQNATANQYAGFVGKIMKHGGVSFKFDSFPEAGGRDEWLTVDQWNSLVMPTEFRPLASFSLATGLRKSNVLGLQWNWLKGDALQIPAEFAKTKRPYGVPLNKTAMTIIQERLQAPAIHVRNVFTIEGEVPYPVKLHRLWKRVLVASGVPDMPYHALRHTHASWMVQGGVPFEIVARLCQWKLPGMIHRYAHFDVEALRPWAEKFDEILRSKSAQSQHTAVQLSETLAVI
jgi:integrase